MLILVVGPSGAGKDTLIAAASQALAGDTRFVFARRAVTRALRPGDEQHEPVSEAEFARREGAGGFAVTWRAHGLQYGLPGEIAIELAAGRHVVVNVSRAVVSELSRRYEVRVIEVSAPAEQIARRLALRGREDAVDIARRMSRAIELKPAAPREVVMNDGTVEQGGKRFIAALLRAAEST